MQNIIEEMQELRDKLNLYIEQKGVKAEFICKKLKIDKSLFCRFRKGTRTVHMQHFLALKNFLNENGVSI